MGKQTKAQAPQDGDVWEKRDDVEEDALLAVLEESLRAIEEAGIAYVFIGGLASILLGPPSSTNDIDFFVRPEDADHLLEALDRKGFATKSHDPTWLLKASKNGVLVDIIFRSQGDIYLDDEMIERSTVEELGGLRLRIVSPEDLMVMKALAHGRDTHYWYDALDLLAHSEIDWEYVLRRARHGPRRMLAFLVYAQSEDLPVPNGAVQTLFDTTYGA